MEKKLISMVDLVLGVAKDSNINYEDSWDTTSNYAKFYIQQIELWMLVPCGKDGLPLEKPSKMYSSGLTFNSKKLTKKGAEYKKAKERVLFEGFEIETIPRLKGFREDMKTVLLKHNGIPLCNVFWHKESKGWYLSNGIKTVEDLVSYGLTLTDTAIKQIGL